MIWLRKIVKTLTTITPVSSMGSNARRGGVREALVAVRAGLARRYQVGEPRSTWRAEVLAPLASRQIHQHVGQGRVSAEPLDQPGEGIAPSSAGVGIVAERT